MPPQIKQDLNRAGWETTDFPSVCENCLPENPYVQMLKEDYGSECKLCTRPFTLFRWKADRTARTKRTTICLTCARLKNCCQCCMLDLSFGLPIVVRDAALKMITPGPTSGVNREYYAQNNEKLLEEGKGLEEYEKTDDKAKDLLRRLANSEPYYKKQRRLDAEAEADGSPSSSTNPETRARLQSSGTPGPIRTSRPGNQRSGRKGAPNPATHLPTPADINPPQDPNITSLFVTGIEDDLPEHALREFFTPFGQLRSLICSHRSHCAFINYASRAGAEAAAHACQGRAVVKGVPLRVAWGKPKPLDNLETEERMAHARAGREVERAVKAVKARGMVGGGEGDGGEGEEGGGKRGEMLVAPPPGEEDVKYASLAGD
ncbi:Pre-mRNA-splicing factor slt11 [Thelotrema lepadinum]|nr:Pre-mRNA-splicing factor slt11 [Thelotrema lepadinum]